MTMLRTYVLFDPIGPALTLLATCLHHASNARPLTSYPPRLRRSLAARASNS